MKPTLRTVILASLLIGAASVAQAQVNAPAPATTNVSAPGMASDNMRSNELAPDPYGTTPKAPMLNLTNTQPAPVTTKPVNYKMTREQCRNLSKSQGYSQEEFTARSIHCDKSYAADTFDKNHPASEEYNQTAPASGTLGTLPAAR